MSRLEDAAGLFGTGSVSWRVDREVLVLAGGSCALLMQAAHPFVAAGVFASYEVKRWRVAINTTGIEL